MDDIFVGRLMSAEPFTVTPDTLVEDAATTMMERDIGSVVVIDDDNAVVGILTNTDFVEIVSKSKPKAETTVERYMTEDVITTHAQASIRDVADLMVEHGFHHVPVVDDTEGLVGIITSTDLTSYISTVQSPSPA